MQLFQQSNVRQCHAQWSVWYLHRLSRDACSATTTECVPKRDRDYRPVSQGYLFAVRSTASTHSAQTQRLTDSQYHCRRDVYLSDCQSLGQHKSCSRNAVGGNDNRVKTKLARITKSLPRVCENNLMQVHANFFDTSRVRLGAKNLYKKKTCVWKHDSRSENLYQSICTSSLHI